MSGIGVFKYKLYDYILMKQQMLGSSMRGDSTVFEKVVTVVTRDMSSHLILRDSNLGSVPLYVSLI